MQFIPNPTFLVRHSAVLAVSIFALSATTTFAAVIAPQTEVASGVPLGAEVSVLDLGGSLLGTAVAESTVLFSESSGPSFQGTMRSVVVSRTDTGTLDFYYQITNTSQDAPVNEPAGGAAELFRFTIDNGFDGVGFSGDNLEAYIRTDGLTGITGAVSSVNGNQSPYSADRPSGVPGGFGFQFSVDPLAPFGDARNVDSGETSRFLLIRTNATTYAPTTFSVSGLGTGQAMAFAPTPEPGALTLLAAGTVLIGFRRKRA